MRIIKIIVATFFLGILALFLMIMVLPKPEQFATHAATPVSTAKAALTPEKSVASSWGCKANDAECASLAEKAEAEYQAKGGDAHEKAEEQAFSKPEALAANEYFEKFMTAKKSGATQGELCQLLQVAHLGYVEAGATDEASNMHDWQIQLRCGS